MSSSFTPRGSAASRSGANQFVLSWGQGCPTSDRTARHKLLMRDMPLHYRTVTGSDGGLAVLGCGGLRLHGLLHFRNGTRWQRKTEPKEALCRNLGTS